MVVATSKSEGVASKQEVDLKKVDDSVKLGYDANKQEKADALVSDALVSLPNGILPKDDLPKDVESLVRDVLNGIGELGESFGNIVPTTGWRVEVAGSGRYKGKYYIWRRGSREKRESRWGGRFSDLSQERQDRYQKRSDLRNARREARNTPTGNL